MPVITLSTDFGWDDPYVGIMKGVILRINPRVTLVDITHGLSPHRLPEAAFKLATAAAYFPRGTIHLNVVDPGVGSARRPIAVKTKTQTWIGPDNGLFTRIVQDHPKARFFHLTNHNYFLKSISHTFHGRDIFAPIAAHLSRGITLASLGNQISDPVFLDLRDPVLKKNSLTGRVLYADRFGNLITNLSRGLIAHYFQPREITVRIGRRLIRGVRESYGQERPGRLLTLFGSSGTLEIACNLGSAAELMEYIPGKVLEVKICIEKTRR